MAHVDNLLCLPARSSRRATSPRDAAQRPGGAEVDELREIIPAQATSSYDVRHVAAALADDGEVTELWTRWSPQLVTGLGRIGGRPVGFVANQPQALAGTLDIAASQKGARFVRFCDAFNLPLVTLVDTPGFLPGKDLEWRGMIRHGAELAFAYAEATVPRVCVILRKAYGGAYIVMDSKGLGNDLCFAWPCAEIAVMGAEGAVQILHRSGPPPRSGQASRPSTPSGSSPPGRPPSGASSTPSSTRPKPGGRGPGPGRPGDVPGAPPRPQARHRSAVAATATGHGVGPGHRAPTGPAGPSGPDGSGPRSGRFRATARSPTGDRAYQTVVSRPAEAEASDWTVAGGR